VGVRKEENGRIKDERGWGVGVRKEENGRSKEGRERWE
jgi:hypothetical protein